VHAHRSIALCLGLLAAVAGADCALADGSVSGRVLDADGKPVAQAVVFVQAPAESRAATRSSATMDQVNKTFVPGVLPIQVGTQVRFPNRDQIRHHVYSFSRTKTFELPLYKGEDAPPVMFDQIGVVKIGCNIHDWMSAIILVLPTSHYAMTDDDGRFTLSGLNPGAYALVAWHAQSRDKPEDTQQQIQIADAGAVDANFRLSLAAARSRPATRGARWDE
jgi:plastocyanin